MPASDEIVFFLVAIASEITTRTRNIARTLTTDQTRAPCRAATGVDPLGRQSNLVPAIHLSRGTLAIGVVKRDGTDLVVRESKRV